MKRGIVYILFFYSSFLFANDSLVLDIDKPQISLQGYYYHFEDTTNTMSIDDVLSKKWSKLSGNPTFTSNKYVRWLRYSISNPSEIDLQRIIFIPYHLIHEIDVYSMSNSRITKLCETGTRRPFNEKDISSVGYPIKFTIKANQNITIILRVQYLYRPLRAINFIMTEKRLIEVLQTNKAIVWFWRGIFFFALIVSLLIYWFVRLKLFLYYFLLNLGIGLYLASQLGDYFLFFNIDRTDLESLIDFSGTIIICMFFPILLNALTPVGKRNPIVWKWIFRFIYFAVFVFAINLFPVVRSSSFMYYSHFYIMILATVIFSIQPIFLIKSMIYKDKYAIPLFLIYSSYVIAGFIDAILPNMGLIADTPFVHNILLISSILVIFSFLVLIAKESLLIYQDREVLLVEREDHQKQVIMSLVQGQEEERNRAGRELHDSIGANMAIIKQQISKQNKTLYAIVSQTIEAVRNISHGLVTPMVRDDEFEDEIKELCHLFSIDSMMVHSYFHLWPKIEPTEITTHLYRITQELLQNAVKHSQAKNVYLQFLGEEGNKISLIYEDDGIGFNYTKTKRKGLGLKNIRNRLELLNGIMRIDTSEAAKGTIIFIDVELYKT